MTTERLHRAHDCLVLFFRPALNASRRAQQVQFDIVFLVKIRQPTTFRIEQQGLGQVHATGLNQRIPREYLLAGSPVPDFSSPEFAA